MDELNQNQEVGNNKGMIAAVVVIVIIVAGVWFYMSRKSAETVLPAVNTPAKTESQVVAPASDSIEGIQNDLNSIDASSTQTDFNSIDADLNKLK